MRGFILSYDRKSNVGLISGDDGNRYEFHALDWNLSTKPTQGLKVYFKQDGQKAKDFILITEKKQESFITKVLFVFVLMFFGYYFFSAITYLSGNDSPNVKVNKEEFRRTVDDMQSENVSPDVKANHEAIKRLTSEIRFTYCNAHGIQCDVSPNAKANTEEFRICCQSSAK